MVSASAGRHEKSSEDRLEDDLKKSARVFHGEIHEVGSCDWGN